MKSKTYEGTVEPYYSFIKTEVVQSPYMSVYLNPCSYEVYTMYREKNVGFVMGTGGGSTELLH